MLRREALLVTLELTLNTVELIAATHGTVYARSWSNPTPDTQHPTCLLLGALVEALRREALLATLTRLHRIQSS